MLILLQKTKPLKFFPFNCNKKTEACWLFVAIHHMLNAQKIVKPI